MKNIMIGIIGGSGLYNIDGMEVLEELDIITPFGKPSAPIRIGRLGGRKIAFLPRHGLGHQFNPTQVPVRANIWALKSIGVFWLISVSAVGSLKEEIVPKDFVIPDQLIDRTRSRVNTFFDDIAVHVGFSHPFHPPLRKILFDACVKNDIKTHNGGTYVCMEGPLFSTKAESLLHRSWGASLIGMTALPEAKLAREAEMSYAAICLATDYDVWKDDDDVDVSEVIANVKANVISAKKALKTAIAAIPLGSENTYGVSNALKNTIMTNSSYFSANTWKNCGLFLAKYYEK